MINIILIGNTFDNLKSKWQKKKNLVKCEHFLILKPSVMVDLISFGYELMILLNQTCEDVTVASVNL